MKNLIMISHNYHSFLLNEIEYAKDYFDKVVVITLYNKETEAKFKEDNNVKLSFFTIQELHCAAFLQLYSVVTKEKREELISAVKNKCVEKKYLKQFLLFLAMERICRTKINKIGLNNNANEWGILSCWYEVDAYATYRVKIRYPEVKIFSLAHSYEVDSIKNKYILQLFRKNYHKSFESISFISKNVMVNFKKTIADKLGLSLNNVEVRYLGTRKYLLGLSTFNKYPPYHILTCSYVVPIKRVERIYSTLRDFANVPIIWTHIGEGQNYNILKNEILKNNNPYLKIDLRGSMENRNIHQFYIDNKIDLFVNFSLAEGIPVSIMEAIAYGVQVVATDVGGNNEIVKDEFGTIIDSNVTDAQLWDAIYNRLTLDENLKEISCEKAAKYFNETFNADKIRKEFYLNMQNKRG